MLTQFSYVSQEKRFDMKDFNRSEKISLLKGIFSGRVSVSDLLPKKIKIKIGPPGIETEYFINDEKNYEIEFNEALNHLSRPIKFNVIDSN